MIALGFKILGLKILISLDLDDRRGQNNIFHGCYHDSMVVTMMPRTK